MSWEESYFAAGFFFKKFGSTWYALCVQDLRFHELKAAGGGAKLNEEPGMAMMRELNEEVGVTVLKSVQVHKQDEIESNHHQVFYLVTELEIVPPLDYVKQTQSRKPGKVNKACYRTLEDFSAKIYPKQKDAFSAAIAKMAEINPDFHDGLCALARTNSKFYSDNDTLIDSFSVRA